MQKLILAALATVAVFCGTVMNEGSIANGIATYGWAYATSDLVAGKEKSYGPIAQEFSTFDVSEVARWQRLRYNTWNDLCMEYRAEIDCSGMAVPKIKTFKPNPFRPGLAGFYDGTDIVYIRKNLKYSEREEVLAHEMSHYLDQMLGLLPPMPVMNSDKPGILSLCMSEKRAWRVSDLYWMKQGYTDKSRKIVGSSWTKWYSHCTPFQSELYPNEFPKA